MQLEQDVELLKTVVGHARQAQLTAERHAAEESRARRVAEEVILEMSARQAAVDAERGELMALLSDYRLQLLLESQRRASLESILSGQAHFTPSQDNIYTASDALDVEMEDSTHPPVDSDISMEDTRSSDSPPPPPEPYIPPPTPDSPADWFDLYESQWHTIRQHSAAGNLTFAHVPWPVFRFVRSLEELDENEVRTFFAKRYPGPLGKTWRDELRRWHTDKFMQMSDKIHKSSTLDVLEGFSRCIKVMTALQNEKKMS